MSERGMWEWRLRGFAIGLGSVLLGVHFGWAVGVGIGLIALGMIPST